MILKGSQRANPTELAIHLMKDENEIVEVAELRGFAADNLMDAFREIQAISRATKCIKYLYSLSFNPPTKENATREQFKEAIARAEDTLGLSGQPRAIVYHTKEGRTHCHVVWSRIDITSMKAIKLNFPKRKLKGVSLELFIQNGWDIPAGFIAGQEADPMNYSYEEYQEAKRGGKEAKRLKLQIKTAWSQADNRQAFEVALERSGLFLAQGDRRGFVCVDYEGNVYSLSRWVGEKTKDIERRLGDPEHLRTVLETQTLVAERMTPKFLEYIEEITVAAREDLHDFETQRGEMAAHQKQQIQALETRQASRWETETIARSERFSGGIKGLWHRISGQHQRVVSENKDHVAKCLQRDKQELSLLRDAQNQTRQRLQEHIETARSKYRDQLEDLYAKIADYRAMGQVPNDMAQEIEQKLGSQRNHIQQVHSLDFEQY